MHTYIHTTYYTHTYMHTFMHTFIHTYIHTYIHTRDITMVTGSLCPPVSRGGGPPGNTLAKARRVWGALVWGTPAHCGHLCGARYAYSCGV